SDRGFASGFLQIPPHDSHPYLWRQVPTAKPVADFHRQVTALAGRTKTEHQVVFEENRVTWQLKFAFWAKMQEVALAWGKLQAAGVNALSNVCAASVLRALGAKVARIVLRKRVWPGKKERRALFDVLARLGGVVEKQKVPVEGELYFKPHWDAGVPGGRSRGGSGS
ncbi:MAG TPA: hypothetical protein PLF96_13050, partial [Thermotogota bacterium]|nr:hypothetical protein [Thermotogota bacterium]